MPNTKIIFFLSFSSCNPKGQTGEIDFENTSQKEENKVPHIAAPKFNADSAFYFVKKQVIYITILLLVRNFD